MSTVPAPIVESNRSARPRFEQTLSSDISPTARDAKSPPDKAALFSVSFTETDICFVAPLEFRNSRLISHIVSPRQSIFSLLSPVTSATTVASRFSPAARARNSAVSFGSSTTAMRSCDSLMASAVPSSPSYFLGTASRSMTRPSASSPMATETPPAPKSLHFFIRRGGLFVSEKALQLSLLRRVALLDLRAAFVYGRNAVRL